MTMWSFRVPGSHVYIHTHIVGGRGQRLLFFPLFFARRGEPTKNQIKKLLCEFVVRFN